MLAKLIKIGMALFFTLLIMGVVGSIVFAVIGFLAPSYMINSPVLSWVLLISGGALTLGSGVVIYRKLYRSFDGIMSKLGQEENEIKQWIQSFYNTSSNSNRTTSNINATISRDSDPPGPGKSRANYSSFPVLMLFPLVA